MPSIGYGDRTVVHQVGMEMQGNDGRCSCCPYGYHIDLDFVPFTKKMLSREEDFERLKELKEKWRSKRKSMSKLLGLQNISPKQPESTPLIPNTTSNVWSEAFGTVASLSILDLKPEPPRKSNEVIIENGLKEAVTDFEEVLQKTRPSSKTLSYECSGSQKYHTFPRFKASMVKHPSPEIPFSSNISSALFSKRPSKISSSVSTMTVRDTTRGTFGDAIQLKNLEASNQESQKWQLSNQSATSFHASRKKTKDVSVGCEVRTRDVGVTHVGVKTRSTGVGNSYESAFGLERFQGPGSISPTSSLNGSLRRRTKTFDIGVQVSGLVMDTGLRSLPVLQIEEGVDIGIQVGGYSDKPAEKPAVRKRHSGIQVKPFTIDVGTYHKPKSRDFGVGSDSWKPVCLPRTKSVGTSASVPADEGKSSLRTLKSSSIGINTDKIRTSTVASNTTETFEDFLKSISSQKDSRSSSQSATTNKENISETDQFRRPNEYLSTTARSPTSPTELSSGISRIPRLAVSCGSLPSTSPKPVARSDRTKSLSPVPSRSSCPADSLQSSSIAVPRRQIYHRTDTYTKEVHVGERPFGGLEPLEEEEREGRRSSSSSSSGCPPVVERREKATPTKEMQGALKVLNDALLRGKSSDEVTSAISIILHEWFGIASTASANPFEVEDYLDSFEIYSPQLLRYIVNMPDGNGNTALHYAVSHGNFDVVSILLDSKVCDPNKANKAGYTSIMLVALAEIICDAHRQVVRRLFSSGDVNIKAAQHKQTALMLGAAHGRLDTVQLLIEAGADINIQDEDGSTALMCAAEHGHFKIAKYLLSHPDCDPAITDADGSTAFTVAMEAGHKDIGVLLYAQMHFNTPPGNFTQRSRSTSASSSSQSTQSSSNRSSPISSKRQSSDLSPLTNK